MLGLLRFMKGKIKIEKEILKPIIKGSKLKSSQDKISEYILFPYIKVDGNTKSFQKKN